ncbi:hypothetical protein [Pseudomonas sichuanensis]|uniref:hypothetical protein n=1 Tax=Pseudomonas sichuanensis TaxID=2213015 RepID=UPI000DA6594E|nr:hypothetical protein [Pseudomonas sichuanensis]
MRLVQGLKIFGAVMLLAVAGGCTPYIQKGAEALPESETAGIRAIEKTLTIATVDGVDTWYILYTQRTEYRLTAGPHRLEIKKWTGTQATRSVFFDVNLIAGREYGMKYIPLEGWMGRVEVVDMKTNERVGIPVSP